MLSWQCKLAWGENCSKKSKDTRKGWLKDIWEMEASGNGLLVPTTNSTHMWCRFRESNPGHSGGRRVLSPLSHPCITPQKWRIFLQLRVQNEFTNSMQKVKSTGGMCFYVKHYLIMNIKFQRWCLFKIWGLPRCKNLWSFSLFCSYC